MNFFSSLKMALTALWVNKTRSLLTLLGIVIGIFSVVVIVASGEGVQRFILREIQGFGTNILSIQPGGSEDDAAGPPASVFGVTVTSLTLEDAEAITDPRNVPDVVDVGSFSAASQSVIQGEQRDVFAIVYGTTPNYFEMMDMEFESGFNFTNDDVKTIRKLVVLGSELKEDLFGDLEAIGKKIKIGNHRYKIVGVVEGGSTFGFETGDMAYVPVTTAQKLLLGVDYLMEIIVEVTSEDRVEDAKEDIARILREQHDIQDPANDDFTIRTIQDALELITMITGALTLFLAAIAAVSLLVGGIGIMNIMLVSVAERTREIGLRKAIGARRRDILIQFLLEAMLLTAIGGAIGFLIGISGAFLTALFGGWAFHISLMAILLPLLMTFFFGIVFGIYPAFKASKLDPITALRNE
jgi:putative ABC transport system permease protein